MCVCSWIPRISHCSVVTNSLQPDALYRLLQARILVWVAIPFSRGSSQPREWTQVSSSAGGFFTSWATREAVCNIPPSVNKDTLPFFPVCAACGKSRDPCCVPDFSEQHSITDCESRRWLTSLIHGVTGRKMLPATDVRVLIPRITNMSGHVAERSWGCWSAGRETVRWTWISRWPHCNSRRPLELIKGSGEATVGPWEDSAPSCWPLKMEKGGQDSGASHSREGQGDGVFLWSRGNQLCWQFSGTPHFRPPDWQEIHLCRFKLSCRDLIQQCLEIEQMSFINSKRLPSTPGLTFF